MVLPSSHGPKLTQRSSNRLKFQIPVFGSICIVCFIWTSFFPSATQSEGGGLKAIPADELVPHFAPSDFEEAVLGRRLNDQTCDGKCQKRDELTMEKSINDEFIMVEGSVMLRYSDPYGCDEIMLPKDDDNDDEDCILELGEGRRRKRREDKRKEAAALKTCLVLQNEDRFTRGDDLKCSKQSNQEVTVCGGAGNQVSGGALAVVRDEKMGWMVWYIFCIFYMFAALAIVCDEFFVPALECFVDEFGISMDVAGATFMAAGGSMPELFTSLIATFQESEVGFVAIVGSAVFNVLFVIAVCAIFAKEVLSLTWWPLFRDCMFYLVALCTVALVFAGSSKNKIEWWEALILLFEYILYCTFMKFNGKIQHFVEKKFAGVKVSPEDPSSQSSASLETGPEQEKTNANFLKPSTIRVGIVKLLTQNAYLHETAGIGVVTQIKGDLEKTFNKLDKDNDGMIDAEEVKELLEKLGCEKDSGQIKVLIRRINRNSGESITFDSFKRWYVSSEVRIEAELTRVFEKFDKNGNGFIDEDELKSVLIAMGHKPTDADISTMMSEILSTPREPGSPQNPSQAAPGQISFGQFEAWYNSSMFFQIKKEQNGQEMLEDEEEDNYLTLDCPEGGCASKFWWVVTYPLCAILFCTMPDVRHPKYKRNWKLAVFEFVASLVWIGIFSNWLYECIVVVSNTLKIPVAVSAVTLLAGGTSVPDLLSSYVVARNGQGDMAVSSSIGSNIFDVTVGLPLPWLLYCMINGKAFDLGAKGSKGIASSILLLILMLGAVIATIMCMRWKMTKSLGVVMLVFYVLYVIFYLLQKLPPDCNADKIGVFQMPF